MAFVYTNDAQTKVADASVTALATTINLVDGSNFATPSGGDVQSLTAFNSDGQKEIMYMSARSGNAITVARGQEGTTALVLSTETIIRGTVTAAGMAAGSGLETGSGSGSSFPPLYVK